MTSPTREDWHSLLIERDRLKALCEESVALLRAWVAGCGDEHFSTKEQCRELLNHSGEFLAALKKAEQAPKP